MDTVSRIATSLGGLVTRATTRRIARLPSRGAFVSFTFDDVPRSACTAGARVLESLGVHGTYYVALGLASGVGPSGPLFAREDLSRLVVRGHELGCHTFDHLDAGARSARELLASCARNRAELSSLLPGRTLRHFAYPFGGVDAMAKRALDGVYASCRTVRGGIHRGVFDRNLIHGNSLYESVPIEKLRALIRETAARGGWLVFYTHDVAEAPSAWGCTPGRLGEMVRCAIGAGARVLTVGQAIAACDTSPATVNRAAR